MNTNVDMNKLQDNAVKIFTSGFACSESVIAAIRDALELDIPDSAIAMSSGFPWGIWNRKLKTAFQNLGINP